MTSEGERDNILDKLVGIVVFAIYMQTLPQPFQEGWNSNIRSLSTHCCLRLRLFKIQSTMKDIRK